MHTPGPWRASNLYPEVTTSEDGILESSKRIANTANYVKPAAEVAANTLLIAAAPDLLAACEQMVKSLNGNVSDFSGMLAAHRALDAAIAKARGAA